MMATIDNIKGMLIWYPFIFVLALNLRYINSLRGRL